MIVKLLTAPTERLKSPVRLGLALPTKTCSLTQMTPSNPNSSSTCMTPTNLCKTLTHLTKSDPAKRIWSLIRAYGQTSFFIMTKQRSRHKQATHIHHSYQQSTQSHVKHSIPVTIDNIVNTTLPLLASACCFTVSSQYDVRVVSWL